MRVAFVGLGNMGGPMARNIQQAGHHLTVYNRTRAKTEPLRAEGATVADSPREAAADAEVVCVCVSTPDDVRAVVLGQDGVRDGASSDAIIVDFSTIDPDTSRTVAAACAEHGLAYLDAPVSGGTTGAHDGTLTVIVGGNRVAFERAQPVFTSVGKNVRHVGDSGSGSTIKLINQMLVAANVSAVMEAFVVGAKANVAPELLYDILSTSSGRSQALDNAIPNHLLKDDFTPGFAIRLLYKDLRLALAMCQGLGMRAAVPEATRNLFDRAIAEGHGEEDMSAIVISLANQASVSLNRGVH